jgi:hypothetical protein
MNKQDPAMIVTGWSNGRPRASGTGLGLRLAKDDRDTYFEPDWQTVLIELPSGSTTRVPLSASFWQSCTELRSAEIGRWMLAEHLSPWPRRQPPKFRLERVGPGRFRLEYG